MRNLATINWRPGAVLKIGLLGTIIWLAFLDLTITYPLPGFVAKYPLTDLGRANNWSPISLLDFVGAIAIILIVYIIAWRIVRSHSENRRMTWLVVGFTAAFSLTLLAMYPVAATDIFEYVFHSRILVRYGQNPLAVAPIVFKGDPFLKTVNWAVQASPYGPLWVILTVPGSLIAGDNLTFNLLLMKGLAAMFHIANTLLVGAILRKVEPSQKTAGMLLFGWNPLVLFEAPGNGHNGIIMMFFALLGIFLLTHRRWIWVLPALLASVLIKYVTALLILPVFLYCLAQYETKTGRVAFVAKTGIITAMLLGFIASPFLAVPAGLLYEASFSSLLAVPSLVYHFLRSSSSDQSARTTTIWTSSIAYVLVYAIGLFSLFRRRQPVQLFILITWMTLAYLFIGAMHFQPWFVVWPIALGIWINHSLTRNVLFAFTGSALLSYVANYVWIWNIRTMNQVHVNLMFVGVIFVPPLLVGLGQLLWRSHTSRTQMTLAYQGK